MSGIYPAFYLQVMHPLYHALKRDGLNAVQRAALATETLDAGGIARLQREKLARLLRGALARSPYYREVIDAGAAEALYEDQRLRTAARPRVRQLRLPRGHLHCARTAGCEGARDQRRPRADRTAGRAGTPRAGRRSRLDLCHRSGQSRHAPDPLRDR